MADTWIASIYDKIEARLQAAAQDYQRRQRFIFPVRDKNANNHNIEITASEWAACSKDERIALIRERGG